MQATARAAVTGALCCPALSITGESSKEYNTYAAAPHPEPYGARCWERGTREAAL